MARRSAKRRLRRAGGLIAAVVAAALLYPGAPWQGMLDAAESAVGSAASEAAGTVADAVDAARAGSGADASAGATLQSGAPEASDRTFTYTTWDPDLYPDYVRVIGPAVVDIEVPAGTVSYSELDALGRTGRAVANVTSSMAQAGSERERADMSQIHPSGWGHNAEVTMPMPDGNDYHGYLFNRSHLIAKSLGGADEVRNMVTGTRTQNVGDNRGGDGGMAYAEGLARDWLEANPTGSVYYSATPVYQGEELLCRSVIVDVRSSDGTLDLELEVFNAARGFTIDYATGEWSAQ